MAHDTAADSNQPRPAFSAIDLGASLTANDLGKSVAWYRDVLGFAVDREHERQGRLIAVSLRAGSVRILVTQDDGAKGQRVKGEGLSLQFTTPQDIDTLAAAAQAAGASFDTEPTDMGGARVFRLRDPDGFRLVITSPRNG